jgi:polyribonucleotide nucleotidyltransferase
MFPKGITNEVQIIASILSSDGEREYGFHGITGASLALLLAGAKEFEGPVSGARIAL